MYDDDKNEGRMDKNSSKISSSNNNAQIPHLNSCKTLGSRSRMAANSQKNQTSKIGCKNVNVKQNRAIEKHSNKKGNVRNKSNKAFVFDGIKVSVNSDEELDYEDDVLMGEEEEIGSIDQKDNAVSSINELDDSDSQEIGGHLRKKNKNPTQEEVVTETDLNLGASSASLIDEQVMNNPHLKRLLNKMLDERILEAKRNGESSDSQLLSKMTPTQINEGKTKNSKQTQGNPVIKSPSDTTIYVPALNRIRTTEVVASAVKANVDKNMLSQESERRFAQADINKIANQKTVTDKGIGERQDVQPELMTKNFEFCRPVTPGF